MRAPDHYNDLPIRAAPGVHEAALGLLIKHNCARTGILDLAAGSGAWLARLADSGFSDLHAVELDLPKFKAPGITPHALDLNQDFATHLDTRRFNLITAIEIIEHLDSPRHFMRQIHRLLDDNGHVLISTPNVSDLIGRLRFAMSGELRYFDENQYRYNHHVSPITDTQMRLMIREVGFDLIDRTTAGTWRGAIARLLMSPLPRSLRGEVNLYLARKSTTPAADVRPGDWSS